MHVDPVLNEQLQQMNDLFLDLPEKPILVGLKYAVGIGVSNQELANAMAQRLAAHGWLSIVKANRFIDAFMITVFIKRT